DAGEYGELGGGPQFTHKRTKESDGARIVSLQNLKRNVPMKISMHAMSHDVFKKALTQLLHLMEKGVANAKTRSFDPNVFVGLRLAPDMLPFSKQIQLTSDFAKNSMARLAGIEAPKFEDNETTLDELVARVKKTLDYIGTVPAAAFEGSEDRDIKIPL